MKERKTAIILAVVLVVAVCAGIFASVYLVSRPFDAT